MKTIIRIQHLCKYYGQTKGIIDLNLEVAKGEIFGFLGPNGAGKTTTIRLLLNLLKPTSGSFSIFDVTPGNGLNSLFARIGNVPGEVRIYENLTGKYFLDFMAGLGNTGSPLRPALLEDFNLSAADLKRRVKYYSRGMKQKLLLIQAMQHDPDLLIMDEPSEGLDPLTREVLYNYLLEFKTQGKTIFFSSHNLPEVEKICDRVALVRDAKLVAEEKIETLRSRAIRHLQVHFSSKPQNLNRLNTGNIELIEENEKQTVFRVRGNIGHFLKELAGFEVEDIIYPQASLEEIFLSYYGNDL